MRNIRIHVEIPLRTGAEVELPAGAARHVATVLRLRAGDMLEMFDGSGGCHRARILEAGKRSVTVRLESFDAREHESPLRTTLVQGISRGQHMDYTLQKAVELGVSRIVPVLSEHSNVRLDETRAERRVEHWQRVVIGACEQCGRNRVPDVSAPRPLAAWLEADRSEGRLVLDPGAQQGLHAVTPPATGITLLSGPEGGLSAAEISAALAAGWLAVRLGPRVLRTETAAVAALAACQALWGDLN